MYDQIIPDIFLLKKIRYKQINVSKSRIYRDVFNYFKQGYSLFSEILSCFWEFYTTYLKTPFPISRDTNALSWIKEHSLLRSMLQIYCLYLQ